MVAEVPWIDPIRWFGIEGGHPMPSGFDQADRRRFLLLTAGVLAAGCQYNSGKGVAMRPSPIGLPPEAGTGIAAATPSVEKTVAGANFRFGPLISRETWTKSKPRSGNGLNWFDGTPSSSERPNSALPDRITVHHDAMRWQGKHNFTKSVERLRSIYTAHVSGRNWNDIGYHFAIDGRGRVWQCRPLKYQGAHVKDENPSNLGVLVMGNFEEQRPTRNQVLALQDALQRFSRYYKVPGRRVYGHRELGATLCPGKNLFPELQRIRKTLS